MILIKMMRKIQYEFNLKQYNTNTILSYKTRCDEKIYQTNIITIFANGSIQYEYHGYKLYQSIVLQ